MCRFLPKAGEKIAILGFGLNNLKNRTGSGVKREGFNTISEIKDGMILFEGYDSSQDNSGENAASGSGDSGGPLFSISGNCIHGVTSGGYMRNNIKYSKYAMTHGNLYGESSFDWIHYASIYYDLSETIGANPKKLYSHFVNKGIDEGRSPSPAYNAHWYFDRNTDLAQNVKSSWRSLYAHWLSYGSFECRDSSPFFNARQYMNLYPEIANNMNRDCKALTSHWEYIGMSQYQRGR